MDMVKQNTALASVSAGFSEDEWTQLGESMEQLKKFSELYCTGCKYCQPCPAGIEIPKIFNMYTYHNVYGLTAHARKMFADYVNNGGKPTAKTVASANGNALSIYRFVASWKRL